MNQGLAPCEQLVRRHQVDESLCGAAWEVGRLVLAPQYRSGPEALKRCLYLTLLYLMDNTDVENLFASCTPVLSRLYRRFGFNVVVKDASQDAQGSYALIHGTVPGVLRALAGSELERHAAEDILRRRKAEVLAC